MGTSFARQHCLIGDTARKVMPHCTDPYVDDPCFRDPSIVDRYGVPIARHNFNRTNQARAWTLIILGLAAMLLVGGIAFGPLGGEFGKVSPGTADSAPSTIGQAR
jgi:hypothetical protein